MWPGPYGQGGGSRKYVLASLDQSLCRMGVDYVDIFYSHRFDADTPLEETAGALASAVQQGKALYIGISSYSATKTLEMAKLLAGYKVPLLIHQPAYNMLNRWIEHELLDTLEKVGAGAIAFTPLAQGLLTGKYLNGVPEDARVNKPGGGSLKQEHLSAQNIEHVRKLNDIAQRRGQSLAQMALAWALRDPRVTSVLIGASRAEQVRENVGALKNLAFSKDELAEIDRYATEGGINLWEKPSTGRLFLLDERRQTFDQHDREHYADQRAKHAQRVVPEFRLAGKRTDKQSPGQRHRNDQDEIADREVGRHSCLHMYSGEGGGSIYGVMHRPRSI
jgi:L-glyceraldehyde 3-phosphate reductase